MTIYAHFFGGKVPFSYSHLKPFMHISFHEIKNPRSVTFEAQCVGLNGAYGSGNTRRDAINKAIQSKCGLTKEHINFLKQVLELEKDPSKAPEFECKIMEIAS